MIKKISISLIFVCLIIAVFLMVAGVRSVELGVPFYTFMKSITREVDNSPIQIPDIPPIPHTDISTDGWNNVLNVLIDFVNFLTTILNFVIAILNFVIRVLTFLFLIIKNFRSFIEVLKDSAVVA